MTDEQLDRLIRDADPYRPLDGADAALLEEIVSTPVLDQLGARRRSRRRLAVAGAAAAVLAGLVAVAVVQRADAPAPPTARPPASAPAVLDSAAILRVAQTSPRLLIDEPGWRVSHVYGFAENNGDLGFSNGPRQLGMTWYPAQHYDGYYKDRLRVSAPTAVTVDGWPGDLFRYNDSDFAVMLRPRGGVFVELRTSGDWNRASFDRVLTHVEQVEARAWLAAMPPEVVTPGRIAEAANRILADVPLPPRFDVAAMGGLGTNDPYQFGAAVTGRVGCAWIAEWERADRAGDKRAKAQAAEALRGSHRWKVLNDMNAEGDFPEVFWQLADRVADGDPPADYASWIGCE